MKRHELLERLLAHPRLARLLAAVAAAGLALLGASLYRHGAEQDLQRELGLHARVLAARLDAGMRSGRAMGALAAAARALPELRSAAQAESPVAVTEPARVAATLETLARSLDSPGVQLFNAAGLPVARWERAGGSTAGTPQPPVARALRREENVYPMVAGSGERVLYLAVPVPGSGGDGAPVAGALVARMGVQALDAMLAEAGRNALLLSPQGVVFAASREDWRLRLAGAAEPERLAAIARRQQFGPSFEGGREPLPLPFDGQPGRPRLDGRGHAAAAGELPWGEGGENWRLLLLEDLSRALPAASLVKQAALVWAASFVLFLLLLRTLQDMAARRRADEASRHATRQLALQAENKTRQAEFAASLQQARDLHALGRVLFARLADMLPLHQASFYVVDVAGGEDAALLLAQAYACDGIPERIERGEGLLGQCALEGRPLSFDAPSAAYWRVRSGLGAAPPRALLLQPIVRNGRLLGVLEVASLAPDGAAQLALIEELLPVLGANLEVLLATLRMEAALGEARTQAEQARHGEDYRRELELWYHGIIDGAPDALLVVDAAGSIVLANVAAEGLFGYGRGELDGLTVEMLVPPESRAAHVSLRESFSGGAGSRTRMAAGRSQVAGITRDGRRIGLAVSLARLPDLPQRGECTCALIRPADDRPQGE